MRGEVGRWLLWSVSYLPELSAPDQLLSDLQYLLLFVSCRHNHGLLQAEFGNSFTFCLSEKWSFSLWIMWIWFRTRFLARNYFAPQGTLTISGNIFDYYNCGMIPASSRGRPEKLQNILQYTGQLLQQRIVWFKMSIVSIKKSWSGFKYIFYSLLHERKYNIEEKAWAWKPKSVDFKPHFFFIPAVWS